MSYSPIEKSIKDIISENYIFNIPRNQRKYVWENNNVIQLLDDIYYTGIDKNIKNHFLGSFVLLKNDSNNYDIIDGQQRITTIELIMCALIYLNIVEFLENKSDEVYNNICYLKDYLYTRTKSGLSPKLNLEDEAFNGLCYYLYDENIIKTEELFEEYQDFIDDNIDNKYIMIYLNIIEGIRSICNDKYENIIMFQDSFFETKVIKITSDNSLEVYSIFEVLNARGVGLMQIELLKNYILKYTPPKSHLDKCKKDWDNMYNLIKDYPDEFLNHFSRMYYGEAIKKEDTYNYIRNHENPKSVVDFFKELRYCAKIYNNIIVGKDANYNELRTYCYFRIKNNRQIRPIILALKYKLKKKIISQKEFENEIIKLMKYFIGFNFMGITSNRIDGHIILCSKEIYNSKTNEDVKNSFMKLYDNIKSYYPTESEFIKCLEDIKFSNKNSKGNIRSELLVLLFAPIIIKKEINTQEYNIDHIIPDSITDEKVWRIGNLMPIKKENHSKIRTDNVKMKLVRYKESGENHLIFFSKNNKVFNDNQLNLRTKELCDLLVKKYFIKL